MAVALLAAGARLTRDELLALPPTALLALLGTRMSAQCVSGCVLDGVLYSVDPHTRALALLQARAARLQQCTVVAHTGLLAAQGPVRAGEGDEYVQADALRLVPSHALVSLEGASHTPTSHVGNAYQPALTICLPRQCSSLRQRVTSPTSAAATCLQTRRAQAPLLLRRHTTRRRRSGDKRQSCQHLRRRVQSRRHCKVRN